MGIFSAVSQLLKRLRGHEAPAVAAMPSADAAIASVANASTTAAESPPLCPYCSHQFENWPSRSRKCPVCKNKVIIRTLPSGKALVTEETAAEIDVERKVVAHRNKLLNILITADITHRDFQRACEKLRRHGPSPWNDSDVAWRLLNERLVRCLKNADHHACKMTYLSMYWFRRLHGDNDPDLVAEMVKMDLLEYAKHGPCLVEVWTECTCPACEQIRGKVQTVEEALSHPLIPVRDCETGKYVFCLYHWRSLN